MRQGKTGVVLVMEAQFSTEYRFIALHHLTVTKKNKHHPEAVPGDDHARTPVPRRRNKPKEIGGPTGPEPTRYGDWERKGRCVDF